VSTRRATAQDVDTVRALAHAFAPSPSRAERVGAGVGQVLIVLYVLAAFAITALWLVALAVLACRVIW
jgi:hypothetical protein